MSSSFFPRAFVSSLVVALAAAVGCSKSHANGVYCPPPDPDGGLGAGLVAASGTVHGPSASASFCNLGVALNEYGGGPVGANVNIDSGQRSTSTYLQTPAGGVQPTLSASLSIAAGTPGVYKSTDAGSCGTLTFSYGIPTKPGVDCSLDGSFSCPTGCVPASTCSSFPCCLPTATTYVYVAGANNCGNQPVGVGSWTLTLSSDSTEDAGFGFGAPIHVPHGTLTATLQGETGVTDTVDVSLSF